VVVQEGDRKDFRLPIRATKASPTQISFGRSASNRPNASAGSPPAARPASPVRVNIRCRVRSPGARPSWAGKIRRTWAAVRPGFSFFSAEASSITSAGSRGADWRGEGTSASNPPRRNRDPPVQRPARKPHRPAGRPNVLPLGQGPDHPPALPRGQRRIGGLPNEHVTEQVDLPGPPQPGLLIIFCFRHAVCGAVRFAVISRRAAAERRGLGCVRAPSRNRTNPGRSAGQFHRVK